MKTRILILATLLSFASFNIASANDGINKKIVESFNKDFSNAQNIQWESRTDFVIATFSLNNGVMFAYYKTDGELIAVARNILSDKLPISQSLSLKKYYRRYWISRLFEVSANDQTAYYVTLENADKKLTLKSENGGDWAEYSKPEKKY